MATRRVYYAPNAIVYKTNLTGDITALQETVVDNPDANWLTATILDSVEVRVSFPSITATPISRGICTVDVCVRKNAAILTSLPVNIYLRVRGSDVNIAESTVGLGGASTLPHTVGVSFIHEDCPQINADFSNMEVVVSIPIAGKGGSKVTGEIGAIVFNFTEEYLDGTQYTNTLTDSISFSDSLFENVLYKKSFFETINTSESLLKRLSKYKLLTDSISILDSQFKRNNKSLIDELISSESMNKIIGYCYYKQLNENINILETLNKNCNIYTNETMILTDSFYKKYSKGFIEQISLLEVINRNAAYHKQLAESFNLIDELNKQFYLQIELIDSLLIGEYFDKQFSIHQDNNFTKLLIDELLISELQLQQSINIMIQNMIVIGDIKEKKVQKNINNLIALNDNLLKQFGAKRAVYDFISGSDLIYKGTAKRRNDLIITSESLNKNLRIAVIDFVDAAESEKEKINKSFIENINQLDSSFKGMKDFLFDEISLIESSNKSSNKRIIDSIIISDSIRKLINKSKNDGLNTSEINYKNHSKPLNDLIAPIDVILVGNDRVVVLTENINLADSAAKIIEKTQFDVLNFLDNLNIKLVKNINLYDVIITTDSLEIDRNIVQLIDSICLDGQKILNIYLIGEQQININLSGEQELKINLLGIKELSSKVEGRRELNVDLRGEQHD